MQQGKWFHNWHDNSIVIFSSNSKGRLINYCTHWCYSFIQSNCFSYNNYELRILGFEISALIGLLIIIDAYTFIKLSRSGSVGVSQVSRNQSGLLNWHSIQIHFIKTVKFIYNILIKQLLHCLSHPFMYLFLCTRGGFRGGSKWF